MDNNPLTYVVSTATLNTVEHWWVVELADFHFIVRYRPGRSNADPDTLSQYPVQLSDHPNEYTETMPPDVVSAIWQRKKAHRDNNVPWVAVLHPIAHETLHEGTSVITPSV